MKPIPYGSRLILAFIALLAGAGSLHAGDITYNVDLTGIGLAGSSIIGTIETDGAVGVLGTTDILSWNLQVYDGVGTTSFTPPTGTVAVDGADLSASATELIFNFDGGDSGYVLFFNPNGLTLWAIQSSGGIPALEIGAITVYTNIYQVTDEYGSQVIGTAPEPSAISLTLIALGALWLTRKRIIPAFR